MSRRRREHDEWHDAKVAAAAIITLAAIFALAELTDYDPPPTPTPAQSPEHAVESERHADALSGQLSRGEGRTEIPSSLGAPTPDTSGRSEDAGKRQPTRPVVGQVWAALAACESSGDPQAVSPTGTYRGLYQFDAATWASVGGTGDPADATRAEQLARAKTLQAREGWSPWPQCAASLGLLP